MAISLPLSSLWAGVTHDRGQSSIKKSSNNSSSSFARRFLGLGTSHSRTASSSNTRGKNSLNAEPKSGNGISVSRDIEVEEILHGSKGDRGSVHVQQV